MWSTIWDVMWFFFWAFAFVAYLMMLFSVVGDLFRDTKLNGFLKAVWILFLVFVPFLTVLVYVIFRGRGMAERQQQRMHAAQQSTDDYIRNVAGKSSADEIAKAQSLLSAGAITPEEFAQLKARALAG